MVLKEAKVSRLHPLGTIKICMSFLSIHLIDVEIFHRINENFDLLVVLEVMSIYPLGTMNIYTIFHGNPLHHCRDI